MAASYANRLNCNWAEKASRKGSRAVAIFMVICAISLLFSAQKVAAGERMPATNPATNPPTQGAGTGATPPAPAAGEAAFQFQSFSVADGIYVLNQGNGTVRLVTGEGRAYSFTFRDDQPVPAPAADDKGRPTASPELGRYQGQLLQNVLFVLDRKTGMAITISAATLVKKVVLADGGLALRPADAPPATNPTGTGAQPEANPQPYGGDHLPPPPVYTNAAAPKELTDADRKRAQRDVDDYSESIHHPSMGKPTDTGYELQLTLENHGKRRLAALEETIEYTDPKTSKVVQQRLYFRQDNGATNEPPQPSKPQTVTIRLPNNDSMPVLRVYTSYLQFAD